MAGALIRRLRLAERLFDVFEMAHYRQASLFEGAL
jgi:hypothetical protein